MPQFRSSRQVGHTAAQMFALVADVDHYPEFVPLCTALRVRKRTTSPEGEVIVADMEVGYRALRERFTSKVTCDAQGLAILVQYIDGPFRRLVNQWKFVDGPREGVSQVEFYIDYEFRSRTLGLVMGAVFDRAFRQFADAFETRANKLYGSPAKRT